MYRRDMAGRMDKALLCVYGAAHFWVDMSCAFLVFWTRYDFADAALAVLVYNFCAFALQMPLGIVADRLDRNGLVAAAGCALVGAAYFVPAGIASCAVAGTGNALFHLGGGLDVLNASREKAWALGTFVAPGALGIFLGRHWGTGILLPFFAPVIGLAAMGGLIAAVSREALGGPGSGNARCGKPDAAAWPVLALLFLAVVLRSYMGSVQAFPWNTGFGTGLAVTAALVAGKVAGGFLMDRVGPSRALAGSLALAAACYVLSDVPAAGLCAVFLFNMTMPVTLWAAARLAPGAKGFSFGLLTFALFLGSVPGLMGMEAPVTGPAACAGVASVSLVLLYMAFRKEAVA